MLSRRDLLRHLLMLPMAATLDVEQLLWVPKPIVTVPALPPAWVGGINAATYSFWRNQQVSGDWSQRETMRAVYDACSFGTYSTDVHIVPFM